MRHCDQTSSCNLGRKFDIVREVEFDRDCTFELLGVRSRRCLWFFSLYDVDGSLLGFRVVGGM